MILITFRYRTKGREAPDSADLHESGNAMDGDGDDNDEASFSLALPGGTIKKNNEAKWESVSSNGIENPPDGAAYFSAVTLAGIEFRQVSLLEFTTTHL